MWPSAAISGKTEHTPLPLPLNQQMANGEKQTAKHQSKNDPIPRRHLRSRRDGEINLFPVLGF